MNLLVISSFNSYQLCTASRFSTDKSDFGIYCQERLVTNTHRLVFVAACGLAAKQNDVTLLKLKYKLTLTDAVNTVCLPDRRFEPGTRCIAAGWGLNDDNGKYHRILTPKV